MSALRRSGYGPSDGPLYGRYYGPGGGDVPVHPPPATYPPRPEPPQPPTSWRVRGGGPAETTWAGEGGGGDGYYASGGPWSEPGRAGGSHQEQPSYPSYNSNYWNSPVRPRAPYPSTYPARPELQGQSLNSYTNGAYVPPYPPGPGANTASYSGAYYAPGYTQTNYSTEVPSTYHSPGNSPTPVSRWIYPQQDCQTEAPPLRGQVSAYPASQKMPPSQSGSRAETLHQPPPQRPTTRKERRRMRALCHRLKQASMEEKDDLDTIIKLYHQAKAQQHIAEKPQGVIPLLIIMLSLATTGQGMELWAAVQRPPGFLFLTPSSPLFPRILHSSCNLSLPCDPRILPRQAPLNVSVEPPPDALLFTTRNCPVTYPYMFRNSRSRATTHSLQTHITTLQNIAVPIVSANLLTQLAQTFASLFQLANVLFYGMVLLGILIAIAIKRTLLALSHLCNQNRLIAATALSLNKKEGGDEERKQAEVWLTSVASPGQL
nr:BAG family molecular chaperone regulator 4 [Dasypus novemcinctus]